ncbi:MAG: type VI secretion system tube protein TssD [Crocinitomicaceae bacterium]|nr:type VI secretion system tube protein TssD [Crocinitomicaceae bacterium]
MLQAKLFVLNHEIPLLQTQMGYTRNVNVGKGEPSKVVGGKISLTFETLDDAHELMHWITRANGGSGASEKSKMEEGKVCFYDKGFENEPTKTYEFNDAYLVHYREYFNSSLGNPMLTTLVISPAIQNYGVENIESWNVSYIPPSEEMPYQPSQEVVVDRPKIYDTYFEDMDGNRIKELTIGTEVYLVVASENVSGKTVDINLSDKDHDFIHEGELLEDDILKDITISGDTHKEKLLIVADHSDTTEGDQSSPQTGPEGQAPVTPGPEKKVTDYYLTDESGEKVEEYEVGDIITLNIKTKNRVGDKLTIHLEDKTHDFKYKGEILEDDKLSDFEITKDEEQIELEVVVQSAKS